VDFYAELSGEQRVIVDEIDDFLREPYPVRPWYHFQGLAGCGKSFVLSRIARKYPQATMCAFTGKAASVLSRRTGMEAITVHAAIYQYCGDDEDREPIFKPKLESGEWEGNIVLLDECGTIGKYIAQDLLNTGCKIVTCGDPGQLRPVRDERFFTTPDAELYEVRRQALDSAIIRQAHAVKHYGVYESDGPDFQVKQFISRDEIMGAGIILCYKNVTRAMLNRLVRSHHGWDRMIPQKGEPVMCLKNNYKYATLNGAVYTLLENHVPGQPMTLVNERGHEVSIPNAWVEDLEAPILQDNHVPFAMAYAATVHKAQGSEWDSLIMVDEYNKEEERREWLYTGFTRAAKSTIIQRDW